MHRERNAKIIATLGPASAEAHVIRKLFVAGIDVFRLNFSHGTHDEHRVLYDVIRDVERSVGRPIGILLDLQGPKLRVGEFADGSATLVAGATFRLDMDEKLGDATRVTLPHPEIFAALEVGTALLVDDGRIRLEVTYCCDAYADTVVCVGGDVSDHKGVNVPDVVLPLPPLTEKDKADLEFGLELGVDWVGLSFVQTPEDCAVLRALMGQAGRSDVQTGETFSALAIGSDCGSCRRGHGSARGPGR